MLLKKITIQIIEIYEQFRAFSSKLGQFRTKIETVRGLYVALTHQAVRLRGLSERIENPSLWGQMAKNHC